MLPQTPAIESLSEEDYAIRLRTLVPQILMTIDKLKMALSHSKNAQVAYIKPLSVKQEESDDGTIEFVPYLTEQDYAPQPVSLEYALENMWDFSESPHRARNSQPRWAGHILVPEDHRGSISALLRELKNLQLKFVETASQLRAASMEVEEGKSRNSMSVLLARNEVFPGDWNYELFVRELYVERNSVADIKTGWDSNSMSTPKRGTLEAVAPFVGDPLVLAAMERHESEHPGSLFLKRFYSTPRLQTQIKYSTGEWSKKLYHSLPTIVFELDNIEDDPTMLKSIPPRLPVKLVDGKVRGIPKGNHASRKKQEVKQLVDGAPWYVVLGAPEST